MGDLIEFDQKCRFELRNISEGFKNSLVDFIVAEI